MRDFFTGQEIAVVWRLSRRSYIIANLRIIGWSILASLVLGAMGYFMGMSEKVSSLTLSLNAASSLLSLYFWVIGVFLAIRRLHDVHASGWWYLLVLIPLVNLIFLLYLFFAKGDNGDNAYGSDPKIVVLSDGTIAPVKSDTALILAIVGIFFLIPVMLILSVIAFFSFQGYSENARDAKRSSDLANIQSKLTMEYVTAWKIPETLSQVVDTNGLFKDPRDGEEKDGCKFGYIYETIRNTQGENCGYKLSACMETGPKKEYMNDMDCKK